MNAVFINRIERIQDSKIECYKEGYVYSISNRWM